MSETSTDFQALAAIVHENTKPEILEAVAGSPAKADFAIVPKGMEIKSLKPLLDELKVKPDRRMGTATADTIDALIALSNRFKNEQSAIFARAVISGAEIKASLTTIFNYHPATPDNNDAQFIDHRAIYNFPVAKDFAFWLKNNCVVMAQDGFAQFMEERIIDMVAPDTSDSKPIENLTPKFADPIQMLELSRDLELYSRETLRTKQRLSSGETELKFTTEHVDGGGKAISIPDFFVIRLALFEGGEEERIIVRLRYRLRDGKVTWWYDMYRIDRALEAAFLSACEQVEGETALPLFVGAPEATPAAPAAFR